MTLARAWARVTGHDGVAPRQVCAHSRSASRSSARERAPRVCSSATRSPRPGRPQPRAGGAQHWACHLCHNGPRTLEPHHARIGGTARIGRGTRSGPGRPDRPPPALDAPPRARNRLERRQVLGAPLAPPKRAPECEEDRPGVNHPARCRHDGRGAALECACWCSDARVRRRRQFPPHDLQSRTGERVESLTPWARPTTW